MFMRSKTFVTVSASASPSVESARMSSIVGHGINAIRTCHQSKVQFETILIAKAKLAQLFATIQGNVLNKYSTWCSLLTGTAARWYTASPINRLFQALTNQEAGCRAEPMNSFELSLSDCAPFRSRKILRKSGQNTCLDLLNFQYKCSFQNHHDLARLLALLRFCQIPQEFHARCRAKCDIGRKETNFPEKRVCFVQVWVSSDHQQP